MRIIGIILVSIGLALFAFIAFNLLRDRGEMISPVPQDNGVKVIYVTPSR